jgi:hypothetical protein
MFEKVLGRYRESNTQEIKARRLVYSVLETTCLAH